MKPNEGKCQLPPQIPMIPSDSPIPFKCLRFKNLLAFAMTIDKAQGQTMIFCSLDLENPCFSHGQLYNIICCEFQG